MKVLKNYFNLMTNANFKFQLDIKKILAERNERTQRELELNGGASESNDSFPATPVLESIIITS